MFGGSRFVAWTLVLTNNTRADRSWRIAYGVVFGVFLASQLALNIPGGKFFRDRLQPLPIAGVLLMAILALDAFRLLLHKNILPQMKTDEHR